MHCRPWLLFAIATLIGGAVPAGAIDCGQYTAGTSGCGGMGPTIRFCMDHPGYASGLSSECVAKENCTAWHGEPSVCAGAYPFGKTSQTSTAKCNYNTDTGKCADPGTSSPPALVCTCNNGQPVDTCTDTSKPCKSCNKGYKFSTGTCQACAADKFIASLGHTITSCATRKVCTNTYGSSANSGFTKQDGDTTQDTVCSVACTDVKAKHTQECGSNQCGLPSKKPLCDQLKAIYKASPLCKCPSSS